ncbi:NHL domain-containing protein [Mucilaginibacter terrigena]|nr:putative Ig domain-containing protein [Mucilaginibacter terrigena]
MLFLTRSKRKINSVCWVFFLLAGFLRASAQAPDITYTTPKVYAPGITIPNLVPLNSGGAVPATIYSTVSTFAGNGTIGHDDGQGEMAQFIEPNGLDKDAAGNMYLADQDNNRIRKITPGGLVSTYAGNGLPGNVNGFGSTVSFSGPRDIAIDADGNMFVVAVYSNVVRRIDAVTGEVTNFAGKGTPGFADGPANTATFNSPTGIAIDAAGLLYVADGGNNMIRIISKTGYVYTLAGARQFGRADGPGNMARFNGPTGITIGPDGNIYITENTNRLIRKMTPNGFVTTIAGDGTFGFADGPAFSAKFGFPAGITFDASGNIIVADWGNNRIRKITPAGIVSTLAGNGLFPPVNGLGKDAQFNLPAGVVIIDGNLYVSEFNNNLIRKIVLTGYTIDKPLPAGLVFDPKTGIISGKPTALSPPTDYEITAYNKDGSSVTTVNIKIDNLPPPPVVPPPVISYQTPQSYTVNTPISQLLPVNTGGPVPASAYSQVTRVAGTAAVAGYVNGPANTAKFSAPYGVAVDKNGNLLVSDYYNSVIRKITPGGQVSTYAGIGSPGSADGPANSASFDELMGITIDADGNLYIADSNNKKIRKITPQGDVSIYAGDGLQGADNGDVLTASFGNPTSIAMDAGGNMYVADQTNSVIRKITPAGVVSTFAGTVGVQGHLDGIGTSALFTNPEAIAVDAVGNVYVTDLAGYVRKITPAGMVTTIAGNGTTTVTDGPALSTGFYGPSGIAVDAVGNVYISDTYHNIIRKIDLTDKISTLAGNGAQGNMDAIGVKANLFRPANLTLDGSGNLFVAEQVNNTISKISLTGYFIDKDLPRGLVFDPKTGSISGTPTIASPLTSYTITAHNLGGSSSTVVKIKVDGLPPVPAVPAPNISYQTPQNYTVNASISPLRPANTGGAVPANVYGVVTTFAGSSQSGNADGTGTSARFSSPAGLTIDRDNNIYVADMANNKVRKITAAGVVTTFAGSGAAGNADGQGTLALLNTPHSVAVDNSRTVYLADQNNHMIKRISPTGLVTTLAGSGAQGAGDGQGLAASFDQPNSIAVDINGNLVVTDANHTVRKITAAGLVSTFAGGQYGTADGNGTAASFSQAAGAAVDKANSIYVVDIATGRLRKITPNAQVATIAGSTLGYADGTGSAAQLNNPAFAAVGPTGDVFITDELNNRIRRVTPAGVVTTFAGNGAQSSVDGTLLSASFYYPYGIAFDNAGNMFVSEINNNTIRKLSLTGYTIDKTLPAGLSFDSKTGIISGTPTAISPATIYTITAYNAGGSSTTTVSIKVSGLTPPPVVPPDITYQTPQTYTVNTSILPLAPANTGGPVPANNYGTVSTFAGSGQPSDIDGLGTAAGFYYPQGIAFDHSGNLFVADIQNHKIRKITPAGQVSTFAGNGSIGFNNDGGTAATFHSPYDLAIDDADNIYVCDLENNAIRKITPLGMVSTFASSTSPSSNDGTNSYLSFYQPEAIAIDADGNLIVADNSNYIRKITPAGVMSIIAGNGSKGSVNGPAATASFELFHGLAIDKAGNIYVSSGDDIRMLTPAGIVSTFAGGGQFYRPASLKFDDAGNLYVADFGNNRIRKVTPAGVVTTLAGNGNGGLVNSDLLTSEFNFPHGIAISPSGNIFVSEIINQDIRELQLTGYSIDKTLPAGLTFDARTGIISGTPTVPSPEIIYTVTAYNAGGSSSAAISIKVNDLPPPPVVVPPNISYQTPQTYVVNTNISPLAPVNLGGAVPANEYGRVSTFAGNGQAGDVDATGLNARFYAPEGIAIDKNDNIYVADALNHKVRKITPSGQVSTLAGNGSAGNADGLGAAARFDSPAGLAVDKFGTVYLGDLNNNQIKKISPAGLATTFAGDGTQSTADGQGTAAGIYKPNSVTFDINGNIIITDNSFLIRKITTAGYVSTLAGSLYGTADGNGTAASFAQPGGAVVDAANNIYVVDSGSGRLRKIAPNGQVTTIAGSSAGYADGIKTAAKFNFPGSIAMDRLGNLFIADVSNNRIRRVTPAGEVTTFAGNGVAASTNGTLLGSSFNTPYGIVFDSSGNLFVSEIVNHTIRKLSLTGYTIDKPLPAGLAFDSKTGTISGKPTVTSPETIYTITAYNAGGSSSTTISIKVVNAILPPAVITFPPIVNKTICDVDFSAGVTSTNAVTPITYTSSNAAVATVSVTGQIHITGSGTTTITASQAGSAVFDPALPVSQSLTVAARDIPLVTIAPDFNTGCEGMTITFTATSSLPNVNYQWQINGVNTGTNSPTLAVTAISKTDVVKCTVTTTGVCPASGTSNPYTNTSIDPVVTPAVTIQSSSTGPVCSGTEITFTATTENEGPAPVYQWLVNGANIGTNSKTFKSSTLNNSDVVSFMLTNTGGACLTTLYAYSAPITADIIESPTPAPSVSISPSANNVYAGTVITFTAIPLNAGAVSKYQWKVNGVNVGNNSSTYTSSAINNNDKITCTITVNINCTYEATSPDLVVSVLLPPTVSAINTFTPNGDGINDTWAIANLVNYPACKVYVYNRAGTLVMESKGYNKAWDGTYQGRTLPVGVYYYIIDLKNGTKSVTGNVTILR